MAGQLEQEKTLKKITSSVEEQEVSAETVPPEDDQVLLTESQIKKNQRSRGHSRI